MSVGRFISNTCLWMALPAVNCMAGEADVPQARMNCNADRVCTFSVTVRHDDTGWEHYADHWRVLDENGDELGRRVLLHPHESEQPFTRSLSGVRIPVDVRRITIQAHDSVHGYGGKEFGLDLP